ncbi:hypothetical protein BX600DRAFT_524676 [Xylariales sp. PMI_506]|nr:hypothetical protein BX600DRAFT_524676 [Xylariales sp. PMI_506]
MDAVEEFFRALPDPDGDHRHIVQNGAVDYMRYLNVTNKLTNLQSADSDHSFLLRLSKMLSGNPVNGMLRFQQQLGKLALSKLPAPQCSTSETQAEVTTHAYLPTKKPKACASCGKGPDNLRTCNSCHIKIDNRLITSVWYCGTDCQKQDWQPHKTICGHRQKFWRAVQLIQVPFIKFQTYSYNSIIEQLFVRDGIVYCIDRSDKECSFTGKSAVQTFFREQALSDEIFLAVLMANKCADIATVCKPLIDILLKPLCSLIEVMCIIPRNVHRSTCVINGADPNAEDHIAMGAHNLLRITLRNGEQIAVDFSGAQLGWHEILAPWEAWQENRALSVGP